MRSLFVISGNFTDVNGVPHGSVSTVYYPSVTLGRTRRMHIYLPPGYETGNSSYPVFYLLHGGGDCDDSWTSIGRANFILDNLLAAGQAKPMIVVMPAGHTSTKMDMRALMTNPASDPFLGDLMNDIIPYVEKHYRVVADPAHRAIAGLSMGGIQTLNAAVLHPGFFAYVGVFSSGWFEASRDQFEQTTWPRSRVRPRAPSSSFGSPPASRTWHCRIPAQRSICSRNTGITRRPMSAKASMPGTTGGTTFMTSRPASFSSRASGPTARDEPTQVSRTFFHPGGSAPARIRRAGFNFREIHARQCGRETVYSLIANEKQSITL
ncbi:MAG: alpha/beta hydrolase-fold protein [Terracidiphilus sp.]